MNYGLVIISPMVLVRLLSDQDFGRYREFLVYVTLLSGIAAFGVNSNLLKFVPEYPAAKWRFVNHSIVMTFVISVLVAGGALLLNEIFAGQLIEEYAVPVAVYVLLSVNIDFWEFLWLAEKRSWAVLRYTTARLVARMIVVTVSAALTKDVWTIIWSLIVLEAVRLLISGVAWRREARDQSKADPVTWREQLQYCVPFGAALVVVTVSKSVGPLLVAKMMGPVALAQFAIGTYLQPVINVVRNSVSDVVLPEMTSQKGHAQPLDRLKLWRSSTVITGIVLCAACVLLAKFADVIIVTLFSETYRAAVPIFQVFLLVFLRATLDFGVPLRAINRNGPILHSNLLSLGLRTVLLIVMIPKWGLMGAVLGIVFAVFAEGTYLAVLTARAFGIRIGSLAPWLDLFKIMAGAVAAGVVLIGDFWTEHLGFFGIFPAGIVYTVVFALILSQLRIPEVEMLIGKLRSMPLPALRRPH
jgi:O-antigen/teichoic acid export membrane protein